MFDRTIFILAFAAALGSGVMGGVFYAFSTAVMRALGTLPPAQGAAAMQSINVAVFNPWFMGAMFGTGALGLVLAAMSLVTWREAGALYLVCGSGAYLAGCILVTIVFNVPLNNALAAANPASGEGAQLWARYLADWTWWNHVRTAACIAASALLVGALAVRAATG